MISKPKMSLSQYCTLSKVFRSFSRVRPHLCLSITGLHSFSNLTQDGFLIFQSKSTDIHQNLALEDWIESNVDLTHLRVLLLWRSRGAVVIGRHQNPWAECDLGAMARAGVPLARRRSGGGTVYHDLGNINMCFFSDRRLYDRQRNLKVVTEALRAIRPELDVTATERLDIVLNGEYKVSGSASRLSRKSSYHHCTLLYSADRSALRDMLRPTVSGIQSNATPSVPSPVTNLTDHAPSLGLEELTGALVRQFNTEFSLSSSLALLDPSDGSLFPGIGLLATELRSWDWTFGKTPKFTVESSLNLCDTLTNDSSSAQLHIEVQKGLISSFDVTVSEKWLPQRSIEELSEVLTGGRFCPYRAAAAVSTLIRSEQDQTRRRLHTLSCAVINVMGQENVTGPL